jgi:hypothetical protein
MVRKFRPDRRQFVEPLEPRQLLAGTAVPATSQHALAKLDSGLKAVWRKYLVESQPATTAASAQPLASGDAVDTGMVTVQTEAQQGHAKALIAELEQLGADQISRRGFGVSAVVPIAALKQMAGLADLHLARPVYALTNAGSVQSQGDQAEQADLARAKFGVDGTGVKIGVLSDSFNSPANTATTIHYAQDIASGDLPANVQVIQDYSPQSMNDPPATDEGRAMLQLAYDTAPGASLAFATAEHGQSSFANNITALAAAGAKVIVDDVIYPDEPMFQDGVIAQAVDSVTSNYGVTYFSAAGNEARHGYESAYRVGDTFAAGAFSSVAGAPTFQGGTAHDFDPSAAVSDTQSFTLPAGKSMELSFQWDQPFYSVSGGAGSLNNMDVYILNSSNQVVAAGVTNNTGGDPVEVVNYSNTSGTSQNYSLMLVNNSTAGAPTPTYLKYVEFFGQVTWNNFTTNSGTAYGHTNANSAESVAAVRFDQTPPFHLTSSPTVEAFSSAGPTSILFDTAGNRLATSITRNTPDITAPDGGATTFLGSSYGSDGLKHFFGTSAAAAEAAAAGALLLQANPSLTPAQVKSALESTALDMDDPDTPGFDTGYDYRTGYGLVRADLAVGSVVGTVGGTFYVDNNANGNKDAADTAGVVGVTVYADVNNNGVMDAGEPHTTTSTTGAYTLAAGPGNYVIRAAAPSGYIVTTSLVATGTVAAGATVSNINFGAFPIVYTGSTGADAYTLRRNASNNSLVEIVYGSTTYDVPMAMISTLTFTPGQGADSLTVDLTNGNPIPSGGVSYDGGTNTDALNITGSSGADSILENATQVTIGAGVITYANIESISVSGNGGNDSLTVDASAGNPIPSSGLTYDGGAGSDSLIFSGTAGADSLTVNATQVLFGTSPITYANTEMITVNTLGGDDTLVQSAQPGAALTFNGGTGNDTLTVNAGTYAFGGDPAAGTASLTVNDNAAVTFPATTGSSPNPRTLAALNIGPGATATLPPATTHASRAVLVANSVSIDPAGALQLNDNDMVVHTMTAAAVQALIGKGYNFSQWNGIGGIDSSMAGADPAKVSALGVLLNNNGSGGRLFGNGAPRGLFDGLDVAVTDVLVKYTYYGDTDLSGSVDSADYSKLDNGYSMGLTGWGNGDFNYDGSTNASDYSIIDTTYVFQSGVR